MADYKEMRKKLVFLSTIISIKKFDFSLKDFDCVIIDEASLIIEPYIIHSLMLAKKFILIGDYNQLSPII